MNEIEEFLRRAAAMRAQQAQQTQQAQQARHPAPVARAPMPRAPAAVEPIMDAEIIEAEEVPGEEVSRQVARHIDTRQFAARASSLAGTVRASDEAIETHMHQVFEHKLGQLGTTTSMVKDSTLDVEEEAAKAALASQAMQVDLRAMFQSPQLIRNAILFSEIFNPPHDRWS